MFFQRYGSVWIGKSNLLSDIPWIEHGISTIKGGNSRPPFSSLNVAYQTNDNPDHVRSNRQRLFECVGIVESHLCEANQVHGDSIAAVSSDGEYADTDGFVSREAGLVLSIRTADCVPVFLVDAHQRAIGLVHAGWRGTAQSIAMKAVEKMILHFGSQPQNLHCFVGPSIGPCCYEVGSEVADAAGETYIRQSRLDMWRWNRDQLRSSGIPEKQIEISRLCTACHSEWFFSHRKSGGNTGRMLSYLMIK